MVCTIIATTRLLAMSGNPPGVMPSWASHARAPPNHPPPPQLCPPPPPNPPHGRGAGCGNIVIRKKVPQLKKPMAPPTPKPRDPTLGTATTRCNPILPPQKELNSVAIYLRHCFLWTHTRFHDAPTRLLPNTITTITTTTTTITTHRTWTISPLVLPDMINRMVDMFKKAEMKLDLAIATHRGTQYFSRASHPTLPNQHNL
jgi:hypothetical protein